MKALDILILVVLFTCGCRHQNGQQGSSFSERRSLAEASDKRLKEASGLAASAANPGMFWTHNDAGNDAEIYLIDKNSEIKLTVTLTGIENRDWEDITVGPGPDSTKSYVYVGDIGDNDAVYLYKYIYRFPEPVLGTADHINISVLDTIIFKLEDTMKDTESLFIDAASSNLYVISKREEPVFLYELKNHQVSNDTFTAYKKLSLPFGEIVAADRFAESGDILIKNYKSIYYWENKNGSDVVTLLRNQPEEVPYEEEPQGEAITWATDGSGFYTLSEKKKKEPSYLYFYPRK